MGVSGQRHATAALCPGERTPGTYCTGGWVGPRAGLNIDVRGKILCPCWGSNLDRPVVQSVVRHYKILTELPGSHIQWYDLTIEFYKNLLFGQKLFGDMQPGKGTDRIVVSKSQLYFLRIVG
jgi:hypothetical protein